MEAAAHAINVRSAIASHALPQQVAAALTETHIDRVCLILIVLQANRVASSLIWCSVATCTRKVATRRWLRLPLRRLRIRVARSTAERACPSSTTNDRRPRNQAPTHGRVLLVEASAAVRRAEESKRSSWSSNTTLILARLIRVQRAPWDSLSRVLFVSLLCCAG